MTPKRRTNLERLLRPRHVAVIGGRDAEVVARECARIGFSGPFWPVNPRRDAIGGHACLASVDDLPEAAPPSIATRTKGGDEDMPKGSAGASRTSGREWRNHGA